jgi:hypothetical protein
MIQNTRRKPVGKKDKHLDVRPLAERVSELVLARKQDECLIWSDEEVQINIEQLIPPTNPQTTTARRKRFRALLRKLLTPRGYVVSNKKYL